MVIFWDDSDDGFSLLGVDLEREDQMILKGADKSAVIPVACLVLVDAGGAVLITQRPYGKSLGGLWEFPGGKVEPGESAETALRRELREELSLEVGNLQAMTPVIHHYDFVTIQLIPFLARCSERPTLHLNEHLAATWTSTPNLPNHPWAPADLPILRELTTILDEAR